MITKINPAKVPPSDDEFIAAWAAADRVDEVAAALELAYSTVATRASRLRRRGVELKKMPGRRLPVGASQAYLMSELDFQRLWNSCSTAAGAAKALCVRAEIVSARAARMRRDGFDMKRMPSGGYASEDRPQPVDEFDAFLQRIADPWAVMPIPDEQERMTEELYRRAAQQRALRPKSSTPEDVPLPASIPVVDTSDINGATHTTFGRKR